MDVRKKQQKRLVKTLKTPRFHNGQRRHDVISSNSSLRKGKIMNEQVANRIDMNGGARKHLILNEKTNTHSFKLTSLLDYDILMKKGTKNKQQNKNKNMSTSKQTTF